jgi:pimeloyl-ACP methyl ester carboxylesterase
MTISSFSRSSQRQCARLAPLRPPGVATGPFVIERFVADLEEFRTHWGHERWVLSGQS